ncbi:helix-turn-helix domain-containing protein [Mycolicibacterium mucogenicum]|uniref:helix-turn-helix domain-containing protein n=1 Tax=Mycolicibacterium mucogenicum TaxID=56689 RepID=UPI00197C0917|nr:helix-turn-helix domain-containing protein [Mycolicibacterium mucogenicum]
MSIDLPEPVVHAAAHITAELIRRHRANNEPISRNLIQTLNALTRAIADSGNNIGATMPTTVQWESTTQAAARCGISERTIRHRAAAGRIPGARKVGTQWAIPTSTSTHSSPNSDNSATTTAQSSTRNR